MNYDNSKQNTKHDEDIMRDIHHRLQHTFHNRLSAGDGWNYIKTKRGETQNSEHSYKKIFKDVIISLGGVIVREAGPQEPKDMTVLWPNGQQFDYELKKKDSKDGMYKCNDTVPDEKTVYVFINTGYQIVQIRSNVAKILNDGLKLTNPESANIDDIRRALDAIDNDPCAANILNLGYLVMTYMSLSVNKGVISLFDFGKFFKRNYKFTTCVFRPRPNFDIYHKDVCRGSLK